MRRLFVFALLAAVAIATTAWADTKTVLDPDDSAGKLDIVAAQHGHKKTKSDRRLLTHKIVTHETWETSVLARENTYVRWTFEPEAGDDVFVLTVKADDKGQLHAGMAVGPEPESFPVGNARVWRPDNRSLKVAFPKRFLKHPSSYRWNVLTSYQEDSQDSECPPPDPSEPIDVPAEATCPDGLGRSVRHSLKSGSFPKTFLRSGGERLQRGVLGSGCWNGLCWDVIGGWPDAVSVKEDAKARIRIRKRQKPSELVVNAYRRVDSRGFPLGNGKRLDYRLHRVRRDGQVVAWDAVFRARGTRHYYLDLFGRWREGDASWKFHFKTF